MKKKFSNLLVLKYFIGQLGKVKFLSIFSIAGLAFETVIGLLIPIYFKEIVDIISKVGVDKTTALGEINQIFIYFVLTLLVIIICRRILDFIIPYCYEKLDYNISLSVFEYLHKHSYNFFINNFAGAINKKVGRLVASMQGLFDILVWDFTRFIITLAFVIFILAIQNIYLGLVFLVWVIIFMGVSLILNKFRLPYIEKAANENSKVGGMYADTIVNNYNISIFGSLKREYEYMKKALDNWLYLEKKSIYLSLFMFSILAIISISGEIGLLYFSINLWFTGSISVGTFVLILTYQINISNQIFSLSNMFGKFGTHIGNSLEMLEILNTPHEIKDAENAKDLEIISGNIEFKDVNFNYNKDVKVFENFNLSIKPGERVGIVGASGSGKSSLVKLLFRFYDLDSGSILINGQDISLVTQDSLRSQISFVPQDTILFHRSLRENIGYSKENVTDEEIIEASKKANCYDFISKLKDGYGTLVGERGIKLSGGERQRVSIARAMLQNNKILVLDEATSALDSESEKLIQDALENLMEHKTMIVIAHRLSTIMKMDRIVVMENGKIIESGSHKELLEKSGTYKKLWDIQSGGFIGE